MAATTAVRAAAVAWLRRHCWTGPLRSSQSSFPGRARPTSSRSALASTRRPASCPPYRSSAARRRSPRASLWTQTSERKAGQTVLPRLGAGKAAATPHRRPALPRGPSDAAPGGGPSLHAGAQRDAEGDAVPLCPEVCSPVSVPGCRWQRCGGDGWQRRLQSGLQRWHGCGGGAVGPGL